MKKRFGQEVGVWTEIKLKCLFDYLQAYSNILSYGGYPKYYFIDAFACTGFCVSKRTKKKIRGSAALALSVNPPFCRYFFIELDNEKVAELEKLKKTFKNLQIEIYSGDCNSVIDKTLAQIEESVPFIALLDPQAGDLYWETIKKISLKNKAELLINFPFGMAINRYMPLYNGKEINKETIEKLNKIFGSQEWQLIYQKRKKKTLTPTQARKKYLELYLFGLKRLGFKYYAVKNIKNSRRTHIFYLIFATRNPKGLEKMKDSFVKDEPERQTLFFLQDVITHIYNEFAMTNNLSLGTIVEKMLTGENVYRVQDFKNALVQLEKDGKLIRINKRPRARSFNESDLFNIK